MYVSKSKNCSKGLLGRSHHPDQFKHSKQLLYYNTTIIICISLQSQNHFIWRESVLFKCLHGDTGRTCRGLVENFILIGVSTKGLLLSASPRFLLIHSFWDTTVVVYFCPYHGVLENKWIWLLYFSGTSTRMYSRVHFKRSHK